MCIGESFGILLVNACIQVIWFDIHFDGWHNRGFCLEGFPSGQREQTVNLSALPSKVRILPPPPRKFLVDKGLAELVGMVDGLVACGKAAKFCGCSSMVEQKPSKLTTRVRFPSPAPGCMSAHVAQW